MGRAILIIRDEGLARHRDLVLDSCLHNWASDELGGENRAEYLYPLISQSDESKWFRDRIVEALVSTDDDGCDLGQLFDVAALFAGDGDAQAREAIYTRLYAGDVEDAHEAADALLKIDGTDGLIAAMGFVGSRPATDYYFWNDDYFIADAEELFGIEEVRLALQQASARPGVAEFLRRIEEVYSPFNSALEIRAAREEKFEKRRAGRHDIPADTLWLEMKQHPEFVSAVRLWMRNAPEGEFRQAAAALSNETDPKRLDAMLFGFWWRTFPLDPAPLTRLIDGSDDDIVLHALKVLERISHEDVRALYLRLLRDPKWSYRAIGLLRSNYRVGDDRTMLDLLERESDLDNLHTMGIDIREVIEHNDVAEGLRLLMLVYEKGPCSMCRYSVVKMIDEMYEVPAWMAEECLHDAYSCTRELAAELTGQNL